MNTSVHGGIATPVPYSNASATRLYGEMIDSQDVEVLCSRLGMAQKDVWRLRRRFNGEDAEHTYDSLVWRSATELWNSITQAAFFFLINEERSSLTKTIFRLRKIPSSQQRLTFDKYLGCVCAFASLSETELTRFFYEVYSEDSATNSGGSMSESAILKLDRELQAMDSAFSRNVGVATKKMASSRDLLTQQQALLTFQDFERLSRQHRVAFYPLFQMQRNVRAGSLGEPYWVEKTREKLEVEVMVRYMTRNHGRQPLLDWKAKILDTIF